MLGAAEHAGSTFARGSGTLDEEAPGEGLDEEDTMAATGTGLARQVEIRNPMGLHALYIGNLYAIHGTNATFGIGPRVSSGCVRLRADDIKYLFDHVPVGTRVQFVNQPVKTTVEPDGSRYMEVHEPLSRTEEEFNSTASVPLPMTPATTRFIAHAESDSNVVKQVLEQRTGMPTRLNPDA